MNAVFSLPESSIKTTLVSAKQIARQDPKYIETEYSDRQSTEQQAKSSNDTGVKSPDSTNAASITEGELCSGVEKRHAEKENNQEKQQFWKT